MFVAERLEHIDAQRLLLEERLVVAGIIVLIKQAQVVAALFSPGGQQRLGVQVEGVVGIAGAEYVQGVGHACLAPLAIAAGAEQVFVLNDIRPVVLAGVVHAEHDLTAA